MHACLLSVSLQAPDHGVLFLVCGGCPCVLETAFGKVPVGVICTLGGKTLPLEMVLACLSQVPFRAVHL